MVGMIEAAPASNTVRTATSRTVGYYEFGDPDGTPVLALHGTPGSGAGFAWADTAARALGIRLIAPDRPGIGHSDRIVPAEGTTVARYAPEIVATADALGVDTFALLGYSGGVPYAVAVAHAAPERVRAAALVSGAGQVGVWASTRDFERTDRRMTRLATQAPALARAALLLSARAAMAAPRAAMRLTQLEMSRADREVMKRFPSSRAAIAAFTGAFLRGADGVVDDYAALARPWGLHVEDVNVPMQLWHATADAVVPLHHSESLARRLPNATLSTWDDEGHLAIISHIDEVLERLLALAGT
jgi:pimeloyl-ACP methyl ester carboxylesterase